MRGIMSAGKPPPGMTRPTILDDSGQYLRAREGECELGTLAIGKTVSGDWPANVGSEVVFAGFSRLKATGASSR